MKYGTRTSPARTRQGVCSVLVPPLLVLVLAICKMVNLTVCMQAKHGMGAWGQSYHFGPVISGSKSSAGIEHELE